MAFLVEHAGRLMSRYQVGRDGRTAYELQAGKPYRRQLVEFGERVCFMPIRPGGARQAKLDPKWQDGAFIGIRDRSDEMLIMTTRGVYKTRNVRRRTSTSSSGRCGGCTGGSCSEQSVHREGRCAEIRIQHELPWLQISDDEHDGTCAH